MRTIRIADLKAHLSEHLRSVRRGHSLTILDRDTPVAHIVPIGTSETKTLSVTRHKSETATGRVVLPAPLKLKRDVVDFLLEERQADR